MAAVLCKGLGKLCSGCTKICTIPCGICCDTLGSLCSNPFCLYVAVTLAFNVPPIALGITAVGQAFGECQASLWLLVDVILCAINIWAAIYVAAKYREPSGEQRGFNRAKQILCYDPSIAVYILVLCGFFIWLCVGVSWIFGGQLYGVDCVEGVKHLMSTSIGLGFSFFGVGFLALCISLMLSCCMDQRPGGSNTVYEIPPTHTNQHNTNKPQANPEAAAHPYSQNRDSENNYPSKSATAVPVSNEQEPVYATVVEPSAPPMSAQNDELDGEAKAVASGVKFGGKIGKLVNADDKTKVKLESTAAKANVAANKGIQAMKKMAGISR